MSHVVTAPLVITKKDDGSDLYLYEGAELPDHVSSDETARLVSAGLVAEVDSSGDSSGDESSSARRRKPAAESN